MDRRPYPSTCRPREYAAQEAEAAGAEGDAEIARRYGRSGGPLRHLLSSRYADDDDNDEEEDENRDDDDGDMDHDGDGEGLTTTREEAGP